MRLHALFTDERAVSSVIGVVLMVAIVVILAAIVGTYALGVGTEKTEIGPSTSFEFEMGSDYVGDDGASDTDNDGFSITHTGGDDLDPSTLRIVVDGTDYLNASGGIDETGIVSPGATSSTDAQQPGDPWQSGESYTLVEDSDSNPGKIEDGDVVRLVWNSPNTDQSATIFKRTLDL